MEFGLGFPCMNLYPPTLQPWEATATSADMVAIARKAEEERKRGKEEKRKRGKEEERKRGREQESQSG